MADITAISDELKNMYPDKYDNANINPKAEIAIKYNVSNFCFAFSFLITSIKE